MANTGETEMDHCAVRIEILKGDTTPNGQQWVKICVNGRLTDLIMYIEPIHSDHSIKQLEHIASEMYRWGFFDGAKETKTAIRSALGIQ